MNFYRYILSLLGLFLLTFSTTHASNFFKPETNAFEEPEFLQVDEAFQYSQLSSTSSIKVAWQIADGYYLYRDRINITSNNDALSFGSRTYSQPGEEKEDPNFGLVTVFHHFVEVTIPIVSNAPGLPEDTIIKLDYQGCAEAGLCYPPQKKTIDLSLIDFSASQTNLTTAPSDGTRQPNTNTDSSTLETSSGIFDFIKTASFGTIIFTFFLLGLGLTFTPCVLPMIPIITSVIAGQQHRTFKNSFALSLSYVLGMSITYAIAGVVMGLVGATANIQAQLQSPAALIVFSTLFVILSLAMFGLYELQLPQFIRDRLNQTSQNMSGGKLGSVFFIGALSALIVSPCVSAPLAGALIYISTTEDAVLGGMSLLSLGLGMGAPLILIAVGGDRLIPKAGVWMDNVKKFFGFMLLGVSIWLMERLLPAGIVMVAWGLLLAFTTVHLGAFDEAKSGIAKTFKTLSLTGFFYAMVILYGALIGNTNPLDPLANYKAINVTQAQGVIDYPKFTRVTSPDLLNNEISAAMKSGKITMLDYYADWCISCKVMEKDVFHTVEVANIMKNFHLVQADVTEVNADTTSLLEKYGLFGPPTILFFDETGREIKSLRILGEINKEEFLKVLSKLPS